VRVALGAARANILSMVVGRGMRLAGIGVVVGLLGAFGAARVLSQLLFGVVPSDPATYAMVAAALASVALLACLIPACRATRVDPIIALRYE
jgi:putative ABC transport system permease protein